MQLEKLAGYQCQHKPVPSHIIPPESFVHTRTNGPLIEVGHERELEGGAGRVRLVGVVGAAGRLPALLQRLPRGGVGVVVEIRLTQWGQQHNLHTDRPKGKCGL